MKTGSPVALAWRISWRPASMKRQNNSIDDSRPIINGHI
jgi:hypothetical protein